MLFSCSRWLTNLFLPRLHEKRNKYIDKALGEDGSAELRHNLEQEVDRVIHFTDRSIALQIVKSANITFLITSVTGTIAVIVAAIAGCAPVFQYIVPALSAATRWGSSLATLPTAYKERMKGAVDAVVKKKKEPAFKSSLATFLSDILRKKVDFEPEQFEMLEVVQAQNEVRIIFKKKEPPRDVISDAIAVPAASIFQI